MARRHTAHALLGVLVSVLLGVALLLPACDLGGHAPPAGPHRGGSIVDDLSLDTQSLLPLQSTLIQEIATDQAIWAPLWYLDPTGMLHPGLAREIPSLANGDISADLKTWTIHLKPNLKWSDGSPLTASDVAFSLTTYADPHFGNTLAFPLHDPGDPIDFLGATALDPTTVQFTLAYPNVTMLAHLNEGVQGPIPQEVFGALKPGDIPKSPQSFLPTVVSGPFIPKEHVQGDHLTVVRNPSYYQGPDKPYLDQITFRFLPNQAAILRAFQAGQLDAAYNLSLANLHRYRARSGYITYLDKYPTSGFEWLLFNLTNPILKDLAVRQALTMSLDPRQIIAQAMDGTAVPDCDDSVGTFAHEPDLTCYPQDPARAQQLLEQDGWRLGADGYRHKGDRRLELRYATTDLDMNPQRVKTEALAQAAWGRIGIKLDIQNQPRYLLFGSTFYKGTFDIVEYFNLAPSYDPDDHWVFMCNLTLRQGGANLTHYCNPEVDQLETTQQVTADVTARRAEFHTIHLAILADLPVMYLYIPRLIGVYRNTLHNYMPTGIGGTETWNVWDWYLSAP
jgi:peptide/nickel transport system substrate-binding protein